MSRTSVQLYLAIPSYVLVNVWCHQSTWWSLKEWNLSIIDDVTRFCDSVLPVKQQILKLRVRRSESHKFWILYASAEKHWWWCHQLSCWRDKMAAALAAHHWVALGTAHKLPDEELSCSVALSADVTRSGSFCLTFTGSQGFWLLGSSDVVRSICCVVCYFTETPSNRVSRSNC